MLSKSMSTKYVLKFTFTMKSFKNFWNSPEIANTVNDRLEMLPFDH